MNKCNTIQQSLVLKAVKELQCHVTADKVYDTIVKKHPDISSGMVYWNLNLMSDMDEIRRVEISNGADHYDHLYYKHYHAKCIKCSRVFDVEMEFITGLEKSIKDTHRF